MLQWSVILSEMFIWRKKLDSENLSNLKMIIQEIMQWLEIVWIDNCHHHIRFNVCCPCLNGLEIQTSDTFWQRHLKKRQPLLLGEQGQNKNVLCQTQQKEMTLLYLQIITSTAKNAMVSCCNISAKGSSLMSDVLEPLADAGVPLAANVKRTANTCASIIADYIEIIFRVIYLWIRFLLS